MNGLEVGGRERVVLQLARRARREGLDHRIALYDTPFRGLELDLDPGDVPLHFVPRGPGIDLRFARALAGLIRELDVEVVHGHNDTAIFYACVAALRLGLRRPHVVATFHTRPGHATRGARLLTRLASRRARHITAVSEEMAQRMVREGWVGRCEVIRNGIDLDEFSPHGQGGGWRERLGIAPDAVLVAHIARFDPVKRHADLVEAARAGARHAPAIEVVLVGQGPLHESIVRSAADCGHVRFVPRVVDVAAFLREVDVFVLCSEHEALPRVLLEAMACERAIVATHVGGVPELLLDGARGPCASLVAPLDPQQLAGEIARLERDPAVGRKARERARDFSADREWSEYLSLYREAASTR
jgi:glycosyltransferase involved in cell wall biosynthesis